MKRWTCSQFANSTYVSPLAAPDLPRLAEKTGIRETAAFFAVDNGTFSLSFSPAFSHENV
jgi:hypothetical protein